MPTPPNASREQIIAALQAGHSIYRITRELRTDKTRVRTIRDEAGIPAYTRRPEPIEEKWRRYARPVDGGHMEWTGERGYTSGTPLLTHQERHLSAAAIAFRMRTGRDPQGVVLADCGLKHCVAPEHVDDVPGRLRTREQLRYLQGGRARPAVCKRGHDQAVHGRLLTDGRQYCGTCKRGRGTGEAVAS